MMVFYVRMEQLEQCFPSPLPQKINSKVNKALFNSSDNNIDDVYKLMCIEYKYSHEKKF